MYSHGWIIIVQSLNKKGLARDRCSYVLFIYDQLSLSVYMFCYLKQQILRW
jgi:hypothetical protein